MGQAKARGTFEERRMQAMVKKEADRLRAIDKEKLRLSKMTPEQKKAEFKYKIRLSQYMGVAMSISKNCYQYKI